MNLEVVTCLPDLYQTTGNWSLWFNRMKLYSLTEEPKGKKSTQLTCTNSVDTDWPFLVLICVRIVSTGQNVAYFSERCENAPTQLECPS